MRENSTKLTTSRKSDIRTLFIFLMLVEFVTMIVTCFLSYGTFSGYFFFNNPADASQGKSYRDVGMDFFNSIFILFTGDPYGQYSSNYPPLASLFFLILQHFIPQDIKDSFPIVQGGYSLRGTAYDLRTYQQSMLLFILFTVVFIVLFIFLIESYMKGYSLSKWFAVACCLTHGVLYGIERGNIILLVLLLSFAFLAGYDSPNPVICELSLLSLSVAAGLKLYPALLGLLLIRDKKWKLAIRTVIYGILAFILPMIPFGGFQILRKYLSCLQNFNSIHSQLGNYGLPFLLHFPSRLLSLIGIPSTYSIVSIIGKITVAVILVLGIFSSKERWQQCLYIVAGIVLLQSSDVYTLSFYLLPFLLLCKEEPVLSGHVMEKVCLFLLLSIIPVIPLSSFQFKCSLLTNFLGNYPEALQYITLSIVVALPAQLCVVFSSLKSIRKTFFLS